LFSLLPASQIAAQDLITDRPDQTESAVTVPLNSLQIETGFVYENLIENNTGVENYSVAGTLIRYGVLDNIESRFGLGYFIRKADVSVYDFDDLLAGLKINLLKEDPDPLDFGLMFHVVVPAASIIGFRFIEPELILALSQSLSERFSISANLGGSWNNQFSEIFYLYTVATGYSLTDKSAAFIEFYGNLSSVFSPVLNIDGGFTHFLSDNLQLDISGGKGITGTDSFWFVSAGASYRINKL